MQILTSRSYIKFATSPLAMLFFDWCIPSYRRKKMLILVMKYQLFIIFIIDNTCIQVFLRLRYKEKNSTNKLESSHAEKSFQITITITINTELNLPCTYFLCSFKFIFSHKVMNVFVILPGKIWYDESAQFIMEDLVYFKVTNRYCVFTGEDNSSGWHFTGSVCERWASTLCQ